ncbi:MAG: hypothetical protein Sv326_0505 [Candidatus Fermentimicrarchaeum limneticum]|uniref:Uncharacterized protein n=1 Tax=Fermentimicrarchaeum limneticum TaxID=2795018 RepID=A0A7D6BFB6_FERL1|nr:MAG: hypothetical protein Sv326_0505 [Candidatus Fermentimicrarchaeum limneticum]
MQKRIRPTVNNYEIVRPGFLGYSKDGSRGYLYDIQSRKILEFKVSKNKEAMTHLNELWHYIQLVSRSDKYLKTYRLLEKLNGKPTLRCRAVRVSMAHSNRKITEHALVNYLMSNFGELEISFRKRSQVIIFYEILAELIEATYAAIAANLNSAVPVGEVKAQKIIRILDYIRLECAKDHNFLYHNWKDVEECERRIRRIIRDQRIISAGQRSLSDF